MLAATTIWLTLKLGNIWLFRHQICSNVLILTLFVSLYVSIKYNDYTNEANTQFKLKSSRNEALVNVYNFSKPLEPHKHSSIQCRKSAKVLNTITTLCMHSFQNDKFISAKIYS